MRITAPALAALVNEAREAAPGECCGVLGGIGGAIEAVFPVANVAPAPGSRYELDPRGLVEARRDAAARGLEVAGFYHSHPRTPPEPSSYDVANALYPECVYVVIGLDPEAVVRAFRIAGGAVAEWAVETDPA